MVTPCWDGGPVGDPDWVPRATERSLPWWDDLQARARSGEDAAKTEVAKLIDGEKLRSRLLAVLSASEVAHNRRSWVVYDRDKQRIMSLYPRGPEMRYDTEEDAVAALVKLDLQDCPLNGPRDVVVAERSQVQAVTLPDGQVVVTQGRDVRADWLADPKASARRIALCGSEAAATTDGGCQLITCGDALCPRCRSEKAAKDSQSWSELVGVLVAAGYRVGLMTLTVPHKPGAMPTVLTSHDWARGYRAPPTDDGWGYATPGESDAAMLERVKGHWRHVRNKSREGSRLWKEVAGCIYGVESTGRGELLQYRGVKGQRTCIHCDHEQADRWQTHLGTSERYRVVGAPCGGCGGRWTPREHVHLHALCLWPPDLDVAAWWAEWASLWCRRTDAVDRGADVEPSKRFPGLDLSMLPSQSPAAAAAAAREVLKYPTKLGERSDAQLVSWLAATKGVHWHQRASQFHAGSTVGKCVTRILDGEDPEHVFEDRDLTGWRAQLARAMSWWKAAQEQSGEGVYLLRGWSMQGGVLAQCEDRLDEAPEDIRWEDLPSAGVIPATWSTVRALVRRDPRIRVNLAIWTHGGIVRRDSRAHSVCTLYAQFVTWQAGNAREGPPEVGVVGTGHSQRCSVAVHLPTNGEVCIHSKD